MEAGTPGPEVMDCIGGGGEAGNDGPMAAAWTKKRRPRRRVWFTYAAPCKGTTIQCMHGEGWLRLHQMHARLLAVVVRRAPAGPILRCEL